MAEESTALDRPLAATPVPIMSDQEIERTWRVAKALAASNFFKDAKQAEAAFAKILLGRDLGLSPTESMQALHVFDGKVEASADFHATRVKRTPGYDYVVAEMTNERVSIQFWRDDDEIGTSTFTIEDAKTAGLWDKPGRNGEPGVWKKYPRNMLFARAMSNGVAWFCPEVMGAVRVYSQGEIEEVTDAVEIPSTAEQDAQMDDLVKAFPPGTTSMILGVYERAKELGHANLSDAATWDLALRGQTPTFAEEWCQQADAEMDRFEEERIVTGQQRTEEAVDGVPPEADVVEVPAGDADAVRAQALRDEANELLDQAQELRDQIPTEDQRGDLDLSSTADELETRAEKLREEADRLSPEQPTLDGEGLG